MSWEGIQAISPSIARELAPAVNRGFEVASIDGPKGPGGEFGQLVTRGLGELNQQLLVSQADLQQLATGNAQNLHQIMMRLEETRLSFQLMMQVRNRVLEAYQDLMKMQM